MSESRYFYLSDNERIVFFGGAGVSTESGIPDFKSPTGVYSAPWAGYPPEEILHRNFFFERTDLFYQFYFSRMVHENVLPNAAHLALASLERSGRLTGVVTQNIDGLHQQAGSVNVAELHGSIHRNRCVKCYKAQPLSYMLAAKPSIPRCPHCGGIMKPDVVLYGEQLSSSVINNAVKMISEADCLIVGGTSLTVHPAAGLIQYFRGKTLILINRDATPYDSRADIKIRRPIGEVLGEIVFGEM